MEKNLRLDWCSFEASKYSCENWHYSKCMPAGKVVKIGVWENDIFIGCVLYSYGANNNLAKSFELSQYECVELTRVALNKHINPVSKIISISLKMIKKQSPNLKLIVSYADLTNQNHLGIIYQASNWIYLGERISKGASYYIINGKKIHGRSVRAKYGSEKNIPYKWEYADEQTKHIYIYPLNNEIKEKYLKDSKLYPKNNMRI